MTFIKFEQLWHLGSEHELWGQKRRKSTYENFARRANIVGASPNGGFKSHSERQGNFEKNKRRSWNYFPEERPSEGATAPCHKPGSSAWLDVTYGSCRCQLCPWNVNPVFFCGPDVSAFSASFSGNGLCHWEEMLLLIKKMTLSNSCRVTWLQGTARWTEFAWCTTRICSCLGVVWCCLRRAEWIFLLLPGPVEQI